MFLLDDIAAAKVVGKLKGFFASKWFWAAVFLIGVIGGTYYTINHWKNDAVSTAVEGADAKATIDTYTAKDAVDVRTEVIDQKYTKLRERTIKDFANARTRLQTSPQAERDAQAPAILIDTLNDLDRLRGSRESDGVSEPEVLPN